MLKNSCRDRQAFPKKKKSSVFKRRGKSQNDWNISTTDDSKKVKLFAKKLYPALKELKRRTV